MIRQIIITTITFGGILAIGLSVNAYKRKHNNTPCNNWTIQSDSTQTTNVIIDPVKS